MKLFFTKRDDKSLKKGISNESCWYLFVIQEIFLFSINTQYSLTFLLLLCAPRKLVFIFTYLYISKVCPSFHVCESGEKNT